MFGILFWLSTATIIYVYVGYPLLVAILAQFRRRQVFPPDFRPSVTLIFAAHNEEKVIAEKLANTLSLEYPRECLQILVVDDGSTDATADIVRAHRDRGIELISFEMRRGKLSALKDALTFASGEILLFSDADNLYPPDALTETVKYFSDPAIGAVTGGRNVIGESSLGKAEGLYWQYEEFIKLQESRIDSCVGVAGDLLAVRKSIYVPPPVGIINDDLYTALSILKTGYRVVHAPQARSYHPVARSEQEEVERRARMAAGRYQIIFSAWHLLPLKKPIVLWQIVSHKYLRLLLPVAMIVAVVANVLALTNIAAINGPDWLVLAAPFNWIFLLLQVLFYLVAGMGLKFRFTGFLGKAMYLPTFLVNSNMAALKGLYRYLTSTQSVVWKKVTR
jgi:cellulose synthase/poly-beta-1,6-N-acetylglucosamine synthase-like glycosyltransferase